MGDLSVLFVGDLVGKAGLRILAEHLDRVVDRFRIDFTIVNVENAADGLGVTPDDAQEVLALGVDCMTSGNHIWDKREVREYLRAEPRLLRPINYPRDLPGAGSYIGSTAAGLKIGVVNVMGRVFMPPADDPFRLAREAVRALRNETSVVVVDMHAEATSEKIAMGWHLDGTASAVLGTHTHVQTADERVLPSGTAYITDVGMTGPHDSIIGMQKENLLARFIDHMPSRMTSAKGDPRLCAVVVRIHPDSGRAASIQRLMLGEKESAASHA